MSSPNVFFDSLTQRYGQLLTLEEVAQVLRYPSVQAVRAAHSRGQLPIPLFRMGPRRRLFASAGALADYLLRLEGNSEGSASVASPWQETECTTPDKEVPMR